MRPKCKLMLLLLTTLIFCARAASAQTTVHYIDVGQADSILVEFPKAALLIDAGGEDTVDGRDADHLINYLDKFFARRTDLSRTIHTIIISHPHIDHTKSLMDVLNAFTVKNLIDGGNKRGSGIRPLRKARAFARTNGIKYFAIRDSQVGANGLTNDALDSLHADDASVEVKLLSGSRRCENGNNDSLVVLARYGAAKFLFTGDAEAERDPRCTAALSHLMNRYRNSNLLDIDVLKVSHHGSFNGTTPDWMRVLTPKISVISAGVPSVAFPGRFHAWFFGHPREDAVVEIEQDTSETRRAPVVVTTMDGVRRVHQKRRVEKAVYCTCWDGDVMVSTDQNGGNLSVEACPR